MPSVDLARLIAFEEGTLSEEETIALFQELIDSGIVWKLQGRYGRTAKRLIELGHCTLNSTGRNGGESCEAP